MVRLQLMSFIAILVHQFEEYGWPGGEPAIMNIVLQGSDIPDHYPLNRFSAMLTNVVIAYTVYLLPVFFPNVIWLGLAPMFMGFMQFIVHGIATNIRLRSFYNPGLGAVVLLHYPIGIYYCWFVAHNGLATTGDWIWGACMPSSLRVSSSVS
ncbi:MAG: HXXEE domain-containing protein [Bacteroidales bacterium]|nr:HXXEE domain-containing protein [Bacteroidales bacterium]